MRSRELRAGIRRLFRLPLHTRPQVDAEEVDIGPQFMSESTVNFTSGEGGPSTLSGRPEPAEGRWTTWGRSVLAVAVVAVLMVLGVANIVTHVRWHDVEDGVLWTARAEGVTAAEVAAGSAAR